MKSRTSQLLVLTAFGLGILMTWVGNRQNAIDAGIVGSVILVSTFVMGFFSPPRDRLWMLAVGGGIPLVGLLVTHHSGFVVAFLAGVIGASAGVSGRKLYSALQATMV